MLRQHLPLSHGTGDVSSLPESIKDPGSGGEGLDSLDYTNDLAVLQYVSNHR